MFAKEYIYEYLKHVLRFAYPDKLTADTVLLDNSEGAYDVYFQFI